MTTRKRKAQLPRRRPRRRINKANRLARMAEQSLIRAATGENLSFREALIRKLDLLYDELAGHAPAPLERLLVDRVVVCWLQMHHADLLLAQAGSMRSRNSREVLEDCDSTPLLACRNSFLHNNLRECMGIEPTESFVQTLHWF